MKRAVVACILTLGSFTQSAQSDVIYVATNGLHVPPFADWVNAATTIQAAIDVASPGDQVLVGAGTYSNGGRVVHGLMTNRVVVDKAITVSSQQGPIFTHIVGFSPTSTFDRAVRPVYLAQGSVLDGFTVRDGATRRSGDSVLEQTGGGVFCEPSAVITNCIISNNYAYTYGGGVRGGLVYQSTVLKNRSANGAGAANAVIHGSIIQSNTATSSGGGLHTCSAYDSTLAGNDSARGGGAYQCTLVRSRILRNISSGGGGGTYDGTSASCTYDGNTANTEGGAASTTDLGNCIVINNSANTGGGVQDGVHSNCTIVANYAFTSGGGTYNGTFRNSIIYANAANSPEANYNGGTFSYSCTYPLPSGTGNFTNAPLFLDTGFALATNSPCIDAGLANGLAEDHNGQYRPLDGNGDGITAIDVGAREYMDVLADSDGDGLSDEAELYDHSTNPADSDSDDDGMMDGWELSMGQSLLAVDAPSVVPTNVVASDWTSPTSVRITWANLQAFTHYEVWRSVAADTNQAALLASLGATNTYLDASALPSTTYYYWIRVTNSLGRSGFSETDSGQLLSPPGTVECSDGTFTDRIRITWSASPGAMYYEVWRSLQGNSASAVVLSTSTTTHTIDFVSPNTTNLHYFWVKARNSSGASVFSSNDTGYVRLPPPNLSFATDGTVDDAVMLSWGAVTGATGYTVWRSTSDNPASAEPVGGGATTVVADGTAAPGVLYTYWVTASNALSVSSLSSSNSGYWLPLPTGVEASDGAYLDRVVVTWSLPPGIDSVEVWRATNASPTAASRIADDVTGTSYSDLSVSSGQLRYYWVKPKCPVGSGNLSASNSGYRSLSPPTVVTAGDNASLDAVTVAWSPVSGAATYEVWRSLTADPGTAMLIATGLTSSSFVDASAPAWRSHYYWIRAAGLGVSAFSTHDLGSKMEVHASDNLEGGYVRIRWSIPDGATSFEVWRNIADDVGSATRMADNLVTNSYDDVSAFPGQLYHYWIKPKNGSQVRFSIPDTGFRAIAPPANVQAGNGTSTENIVVTWNAAGAATSYEVWRGVSSSSNAASLVASGLTSTVYTDSPPAQALVYYYWVKAAGSIAISGFSSSDWGFRRMDAPTFLNATDGTPDDRVVLTWQPVLGAVFYEVWRNSVDNSGTATLHADFVTDTRFDDPAGDTHAVHVYWVKAKNAVSTSDFSLPDSGSAGVDSSLDSDGDGIPDAQEIHAGTDPNDSNSFLRVISSDLSGDAGFAIAWPSSSNRLYRVDVCTNLGSGYFTSIATGIPSTPPVTSYTDTNTAPSEARIYRIVVE